LVVELQDLDPDAETTALMHAEAGVDEPFEELRLRSL
jgi:hypothetical protein